MKDAVKAEAEVRLLLWLRDRLSTSGATGLGRNFRVERRVRTASVTEPASTCWLCVRGLAMALPVSAV